MNDTRYCATLSVDLAALRANYFLLKKQHAKGTIAAVVKANAYGLGVETVSKTLWGEGCREFFVATLEEGIELHRILPDVSIGVFNGLFAGEEQEYAQHKLTPVLNDVGQVERAAQWQVASGEWQVIIHVDTGITRLGLSESDLKQLIHSPLATCHSPLLMSHLACSNDPDHPKNKEQLARFESARKLFPHVRCSMANSSGLFLSPDYHYDIGRPGCALYGINPVAGENPMRHVATLSAPLLQIRTLDRDETVGYGATHTAKKGSRIAIAGIGYSDGVMRNLSGKGFAYVAGQKAPFAGRVSMDMIALDVSAIPESVLTPDIRAEFINAEQTVGDMAAACGTIGYEIFTRIGRRVKRVYK